MNINFSNIEENINNDLKVMGYNANNLDQEARYALYDLESGEISKESICPHCHHEMVEKFVEGVDFDGYKYVCNCGHQSKTYWENFED